MTQTTHHSATTMEGVLGQSSPFWINERQRTLHVRRYSPEIVAAVRENGLIGLQLGGWDQPDLAVLLPLRDQITFLSVQCEGATPNLAAVAEFTHLKTLYVTSGLDAIDFARLPDLQTVAIWDETPRFGNLWQARSLRRVDITNSGLRDLEPLSNLSQIKRLSITEAPLRSLAGVERLTSLETLFLSQVPVDSLDALRASSSLAHVSLAFARRITSIAPLVDLPTLRSVELTSVKKVTDLHPLGEIAALESLSLDGADLKSADWISRLVRLQTLKLANVGTFPSLRFLEPLDRLVHFSLVEKSVVADDDLSVLLRLPSLREVHLARRKTYSPTPDEITAVLSARHAGD